jgi:NhaA family Na+:H+ antiporter
MSEGRRSGAELGQLPRESINRLTKPFAGFSGTEAAAGAVLLLFTLAGLFLSNSPWARPFCSAWNTMYKQGEKYEKDWKT